MAQVPAEPGQPASGMRLVRFVGVDGPRWFLRGLFTGPAADGGEQAELLEEVLRDVVVVRGEHPVPPGRYSSCGCRPRRGRRSRSRPPRRRRTGSAGT